MREMTTATTTYDRAKAFETLTCPFCGRTEKTEWLLANNHWLRRPGEGGFDYPAENGACVAQKLIRNHLTHDVKALATGTSSLYRTRSGKFDEATARKAFVESLAAAREWGVDADAILAAFPIVCAPCKDGRCRDCFEDTTWSMITEDLVVCGCTEADHV